jgi:hypothetical protein
LTKLALQGGARDSFVCGSRVATNEGERPTSGKARADLRFKFAPCRCFVKDCRRSAQHSSVVNEQTYRLVLAALCFRACIRRPVSTDDGSALRGGIEVKMYGGTDLLLVVDNSASMADKQRLLAQALRRELEVLICPNEDGTSIRVERGETPEGVSCTSPLDGTRIGLITTDSGSGCGVSTDRAHPVPLPNGSLFFDAHEHSS